MGKLFLKLYTILLIGVAVFVLGVVNLDSILAGIMNSHLEYLARGTTRMLERNLGRLPQSQWAEYIAGTNAGNGYPLRLLHMKEVDLPSEQFKRLDQNAVVFHRYRNAHYQYKRIKGTDWVLVIPFEQNEYEHTQRLASSTLNVIIQALQRQLKTQWQETVSQLAGDFTFPVKLESAARADLSELQLQELRQGQVVWQETGATHEYLYRLVPDSDYMVRIGPFDEPVALTHLRSILIISIALIVALAVLFWVYPLWRDLRRLGTTTKMFGEGRFDIRAQLPKRSVLHRLANTFDAMAERIQRLISSHKELTNAVSHELRTPIARLRFGMQMLEDATDDAARERHMQSMNADIDELDRLVAELLTYARFDREAPKMEFTRQNVAPWLDEVLRQAQMGVSGISLERRVDCAEHEKDAKFEPRLMARALQNLLLNARRYANNKIQVRFTRHNDECVISVDDDGPGIPPDKREQVFEAFTRLDASRDRGTGGYGLGLAIVHRIAQWHKGSVSATTSDLGGACFVIRWPGG